MNAGTLHDTDTVDQVITYATTAPKRFIPGHDNVRDVTRGVIRNVHLRFSRCNGGILYIMCTLHTKHIGCRGIDFYPALLQPSASDLPPHIIATPGSMHSNNKRGELKASFPSTSSAGVKGCHPFNVLLQIMLHGHLLQPCSLMSCVCGV